MTGRVLVTGANGNIGSLLVPSLAQDHNLAVRALVRDPGKGQPLAAANAEVVFGFFEKPATLVEAMDDVDTVVLIVPPNKDCVAQNRAIVDAAVDSGVRKVVRISAIKAATDGRTESTRLHGECEEILISSGLDYVMLRPNYYMQNIFMSLESINGQNVVVAGMGDGRLAQIDVRDVADAASVAVRTDDFDNQVLEISGPESISFHDVARILSEVAGREIAYVPVTPEQVRDGLISMGVDAWMAKLLEEYSAAYADDWGDLVTDNIERMTGHAPRDFATFARDCLTGLLS